MAYGTETIPRRGQDRWPWQRLRDRGEARGLWRRGRGRPAGAERGRCNSRRERLTGDGRPRPPGPGRAPIGSLGDTPHPERRAHRERRAASLGKPADLVTVVHVRDLSQAVEISNLYAPEHAHVISGNDEEILRNLDASGWSPSAMRALWPSPTTAPALARPADRRDRDLGLGSGHPRLHNPHQLRSLHRRGARVVRPERRAPRAPRGLREPRRERRGAPARQKGGDGP